MIFIKIMFSFFICILPFSHVCAYAQSQEAEGSKIVVSIYDYDFPGLKNKISVDFRGMDVMDVLKFLAIEGDLNVVAAKDVVGPVSFLINDVEVGDAFEMVISINHLAYEVRGNIIKVTSNADYKIRRGVDFFDQREAKVFQLTFASSKDVGSLLGNVKSEIGKIIFDDSTGMLVLIDTPQKIQEMAKIIDSAENATEEKILQMETRIFELKYAKVEDVKEEIAQALTPETGTMRVDVRTNALVINDTSSQIKEIADMIMTFDRKTREVFIEAKIVQVTLSDTHKWGVNWSKLFNQGGDARDLTTNAEMKMPLNLATFGRVTLSSTDSNLSMILEMLTTVGETKILSNPHIAVEEGKEATINVITKQPYSQSTTTTTTAATTSSTEFTFVDVGVKLTVTPTINFDGYISMIISPEVSSITSFFPSEASDQRVPVVETSNAQSTVMVKDGTTIIIAGMIRDSKTSSLNKVPVLGDMPMIGKIFSNSSNALQSTETIVFLTPTIITGDRSYLLERDKVKPIKGIRR